MSNFKNLKKLGRIIFYFCVLPKFLGPKCNLFMGCSCGLTACSWARNTPQDCMPHTRADHPAMPPHGNQPHCPLPCTTTALPCASPPARPPAIALAAPPLPDRPALPLAAYEWWCPRVANGLSTLTTTIHAPVAPDHPHCLDLSPHRTPSAPVALRRSHYPLMWLRWTTCQIF